MYLGKKKKFKVLTYCTTAIVISSFSNVASAANESSNSSGNIITITNDEQAGNNSDIIAGSSETGDASNNTANVSNTTTVTRILVGATSAGNAENNIANVQDVENVSFIDGGYAYEGSGNATGNVVNFYSGTANEIHGGHAHYGDATGNTVNVYGGTVTSEIGGGYSDYGNANDNALNIYDGTINGTAYGGRSSYYGQTSGDATGDTVNIYGGTINGDVYGGWAPYGNATDNNLSIYGSPDLSGANLYGGLGSNGVSGNSLNIHTQGITAKNIYGFDNLNFHIPSDVGSNPILTLTDGATDLTQTTVNIYADGSNLTPNTELTLLYNNNTISTSGITNDGVISQGVSLDYKISNLGLSSDRKSFVATIGEADSLKKQTNILNNAIIDSASLLDSGTDRLAEWLPPEGLGESIPTTQFNPFAGLGGSVFKIKTSDGQTLKSKNAGLDVGMARFVRNGKGILVFGPITDYGQDSYESHFTHPRSEGSTEMYTTDGSGNSRYFAAGIIARQMTANNQGMYYEASLRGGMVHTNFSSDNFLVHDVETHADYSASTPCFAGHVRVGWSGNIGGTSRLDAYGVYSLNRVNGFDTTLSTGENYKFSSVNSGRARIGARLTRDYKDKHTFYSGLACVHEFTGDTQGEYLGRTTNKSGLDGTSGLIELGWRFKQMAASTTMLDVSMIGWVGHQKGVTFSAKYKRDF